MTRVIPRSALVHGPALGFDIDLLIGSLSSGMWTSPSCVGRGSGSPSWCAPRGRNGAAHPAAGGRQFTGGVAAGGPPPTPAHSAADDRTACGTATPTRPGYRAARCPNPAARARSVGDIAAPWDADARTRARPAVARGHDGPPTRRVTVRPGPAPVRRQITGWIVDRVSALWEVWDGRGPRPDCLR
jgi:hypothetical protein